MHLTDHCSVDALTNYKKKVMEFVNMMSLTTKDKVKTLGENDDKGGESEDPD